jgi:hypothetical protein
LAGENPHLTTYEQAIKDKNKRLKKMGWDIDAEYSHENPDKPIIVTYETDALRAFLRTKSHQIAHLRKKFDTDAELCDACACSKDDIDHWELFPDEGTMRLAGELPRDRLALLLINARAFGVHITKDDILKGLGQEND